MAACCAVPLCPALPLEDGMFCDVHRFVTRAEHVMAGTKCAVCGRALERGDWVMRFASGETMRHAVCPPASQPFSRKKDRPKRVAAAGDLEQPF